MILGIAFVLVGILLIFWLYHVVAVVYGLPTLIGN